MLYLCALCVPDNLSFCYFIKIDLEVIIAKELGEDIHPEVSEIKDDVITWEKVSAN